jgi:hypothetical protein
MPPPERLPAAALAQLAIDVVEGRMYVTNTPEGVRLSFGLLIAMIDWDEAAEQIGAFYAPMSEALPRSINGLPMFTSIKVLHVDDLQPLHDKIKEYEKQREAFIQPANAG